jgi:hypothetical protein
VVKRTWNKRERAPVQLPTLEMPEKDNDRQVQEEETNKKKRNKNK